MTEHNPYKAKSNKSSGVIINRHMIQDHADKLNVMNWVVDSERFYFVNQKVDDNGQVVHFLDRQQLPPKKPREKFDTSRVLRDVQAQFGSRRNQGGQA